MISTTKEIELNNKELLDLFNGIKDEFFRLRDEHGIECGISLNAMEGVTHEWLCSEEALLVMDRESHAGYPETYYSINIPQLRRASPQSWGDYAKYVKNIPTKLLGATSSGLSLFYPPTGFVGWHTNHNNPTYQILFSWSETGDGYFRYEDPKTKEIVTLHDKPGWNVRVHYFGSLSEPDDMLWHCAYTNCDRFSFAFQWIVREKGTPEDDLILSVLEDVIEEISSV